MIPTDKTEKPQSTRREFLKTSTGAVLGGLSLASLSEVPAVHAAGSEEIKLV